MPAVKAVSMDKKTVFTGKETTGIAMVDEVDLENLLAGRGGFVRLAHW